ncbi:MAG: ATP-binding protein [Candidatus Magasanikbacteria bacterium]|nr:ATP-binding protein [Candidatus Magasanikbacteria bacterium]
MFNKQKTIKVSVDKSHLLTLGERMYVESIELIRELVNNAYDADATEVRVILNADKVLIEDNGSGMNEKGLGQFFTVGSEEKRVNSVSPRFGRKRIGQFGIGKFAALAAAECFSVESNRGGYVYSVVFDRNEWQKNDEWELPIKKYASSPLEKEGTTVTLSKLKKAFSFADVERFLKESVPLRAKKFSVFLNNKKITARYIPGRRVPILHKTLYGAIEGEIVIALRSSSFDKHGIECRVRQALVRREFFDLEKIYHAGLNRIAGEVNADFLQVVSGRDDFIRDSAEFKIFYQLVRADLEKVLKDLKHDGDAKHLKKINTELKDALSKIRVAMELHPELTPSGRTIAVRKKLSRELTAGALVAADENLKNEKTKIEDTEESKKQARQKSTEQPKQPMPQPEVIKRIRLQKLGISVAIVSLGAEAQEAVTEDNLIYVNSDHPIYKKLYNKKEQFELHLLRLISQEIILMKKLRITAKEAFEWQSTLLKDAICR